MSISSTQRKDTLTVWRHREERLFYAFNKETASIWVSAVVTQINHLKSQRHLTRCVVGFICEEQRHPRKKACHLSSFISLWLMLVLNYLSTVCLHSTGGDLKDGKREREMTEGRWIRNGWKRLNGGGKKWLHCRFNEGEKWGGQGKVRYHTRHWDIPNRSFHCTTFREQVLSLWESKNAYSQKIPSKWWGRI